MNTDGNKRPFAGIHPCRSVLIRGLKMPCSDRQTNSPTRCGPPITAHVSAMPTYEYECPKCGHAFELFQSMRDEPLKRCPKCGKAGVKRLVGGGAGLIFKGSGFY